MRCSVCPYKQEYLRHGFKYDSCFITLPKERTVNKYGPGCKFNLVSLDRRKRMLDEAGTRL